LEIMESELTLDGQLVRIIHPGSSTEFPTVRVMFESVSLQQQRGLIEMLFCRPGQWQRRNSPGELRSLWLLLRILLRPRVLFDREVDVRALSVSKV
jgi:cellulose synthase (UDP-forming)